MSRGGRRPAVFLDRDGTTIVERSYLADPEGVRLVPGAAGALAGLRDAGYLLVLVTNQSGIARGLYGLDDYRRVAARLDTVLGREGVRLDDVRYCPHHPDVGGACSCRKPATGMHRAAARALRADLAASWYVGDKLSDVLPARELGGRGILVRTGHGRELEAAAPDGVVVVDDLPAAAAHVLGADGGEADARRAAGRRARERP